MKRKKWRKREWIYRLIFLGLVLIICDPRLKTVRYTFESEKIEKPIKVALLTDLHGSWYGKNQSTLIKEVVKAAPDAVLLGGDFFVENVSYKESEETLDILSKKYKCYYVTGNHEFWSGDIDNILKIVDSYDVTILQGEEDLLEIGGQKISICGVDDPDYFAYVSKAPSIVKQLEQLEKNRDKAAYSILLSHRPEYYETYQKYRYDLVLSGHAHGGQWRIPGILNGLYAPHQGLFPDYAGGPYDYPGGTLVVSRGLDRWGIKIPRIFNRPELVIIDVK